MGKKICVSYFFMRNPYMEFQNPGMHGSGVMLCIKKRNGRTHRRTDWRTHKRPIICPPNFFEVGGIINSLITGVCGRAPTTRMSHSCLPYQSRRNDNKWKTMFVKNWIFFSCQGLNTVEAGYKKTYRMLYIRDVYYGPPTSTQYNRDFCDVVEIFNSLQRSEGTDTQRWSSGVGFFFFFFFFFANALDCFLYWFLLFF